MRQWIKTNWVLLAILAIAFLFRFWQINSLPAGLFPDEAAYGIDGRSITQGDFQPFFERGNGREGLFMYFLALTISIFGYHPWANHLVTASFGLGTVIVTYLIAREIFGRKTAYLATFLIATSSYAVTVTRTAFRANTMPFFGALTIYFVIKIFTSADPKSRWRNGILAGLFFGLGFYTYISYRMLLPLLFGFAVILLFANRNRLMWVWSEYKKTILGFALAFLVAFAWIGFYFFVSHPGSFVGRAGQVSVFSPELNHGDLIGTVIDVFKKTILGYFTAGDLNWRHNISGAPFLAPLVSPLFGITLIWFTWQFLVLLKQSWQKDIKPGTAYRALLAMWFWFMLVPEVTTAEGIPHGLRLIGTIPVIFIISAHGLVWVWHKIEQSLYISRARYYFATIFFATVFVYGFYLYFGVAANSAEYYYSFRSDLTEVSNYLNERSNRDATYLSLDAFSVQSVDYLTTPSHQPYILLVPEHSYLQQLKKGDQIIFTQSTLPDGEKYKLIHPNISLVKEELNQFGQVIMRVYEQ